MTSICHSFQLKGWVETQLPIVFRESVTLVRCSYPNFLQGNDHLIFPQSLPLRILPPQSLSPKLRLTYTNTQSFPLLYRVNFAPYYYNLFGSRNSNFMFHSPSYLQPKPSIGCMADSQLNE